MSLPHCCRIAADATADAADATASADAAATNTAISSLYSDAETKLKQTCFPRCSGRYHEKLFFNSGFAFLAGSVAGTMYGAAEGLRGAASSKVKVRVNAVLNGAGKYSASWGNAMGVVGTCPPNPRRRPFPVGSFPSTHAPTHTRRVLPRSLRRTYLFYRHFYRPLLLHYAAACKADGEGDVDIIPPLANPPSLPRPTTASPVLYDRGEPGQLCGARRIRWWRPGAWGVTKECMSHTRQYGGLPATHQHRYHAIQAADLLASLCPVCPLPERESRGRGHLDGHALQVHCAATDNGARGRDRWRAGGCELPC